MVQQVESGFKTILGAKLTTTATSMTVATIPTVTAGRLYLNNGAQEERISFTGRSGTTITGLTRGLSKTAVPSTAGTGLSWIAGTPVILVEMHDQMMVASQDNLMSGNNTLSGDNSFTGTNTFSSITKINTIIQNVTNTQMNALTGVINGAIVYNTTAGEMYQYIGGAWSAVSSGSTQANASETVAGKVEAATSAETIAGTDTGGTGALLFSHPSDQITLLGKFGDGSDGDVTVTGGTTTLTRDMYYNTLTVEASGVIATAGYRIFVKGTFNNAGTIQHNGGNGTNGDDAISTDYGLGGAGGVAAAAGTLKASGAGSGGGSGGKDQQVGAPGTTPGNGGAVSAITQGLGSAGGVGGNGGEAGNSPGTGGTVGTVTKTKSPHTYNEWMNFFYTQYATDSTFVFYSGSSGGSGGGGGGVDGSNGAGQGGFGGGSGGGGGGGGIVFICAKTIINTANIFAKGGNGGNGGNGYAQANSPAKGGGAGTGGGGAGGVIILIYSTKTDSGSISVAGGTAGATVGLGYDNNQVANAAYNGVVGSAGTTGVIYNVPIA